MELIKKSARKWIASLILLAAGILIIVAGATFGKVVIDPDGSISDPSNSAFSAVSLIVGIVLIIFGGIGLLVNMVTSYFFRKRFVSMDTLFNCLFLSIGIWLVIKQQIAFVIGIILSFTPVLLIVLGSLLIVNCLSIFIHIWRGGSKRNFIIAFMCFLIGAFLIALGILSLTVASSGETIIPYYVQLIIFGALAIGVSITLFISTLIPFPNIATYLGLN